MYPIYITHTKFSWIATEQNFPYRIHNKTIHEYIFKEWNTVKNLQYVFFKHLSSDDIHALHGSTL